MVQGLGYAAISLAARRRHAPRLSRRVRRPNRARLSAAQRRSRAVAVSAPVHRGDAIDRRRGINDMRRRAAREAGYIEKLLRPRAFALHAHLGRDRAGVAHVLVIVDLLAALEVIEIAGQQRVTMEVKQSALLREQESEILLGRDLRDLAQRLVLGVVIAGLGAAVALLFEVEQLPLGNAERLVDGFVQIGMAVFPQEVLGLVADDEIGAAGNAQLDMDHRRNGAGAIFGALVDPQAARDQPAVEPFEVGHAGTDFLLCPIRTFDIMKSDLQGYLKHPAAPYLGHFLAFLIASGGPESLQRIGKRGLCPVLARSRKESRVTWLDLATAQRSS